MCREFSYVDDSDEESEEEPEDPDEGWEEEEEEWDAVYEAMTGEGLSSAEASRCADQLQEDRRRELLPGFD